MHGPLWVSALFLLCVEICSAAASHRLAVNPEIPTSEDNVAILIAGDWPEGGGPSITRWTRNGPLIRIDALGVLPGIPQPVSPYQLSVEIGRLPPGRYRVAYYIEVLAAPGKAPAAKGLGDPLPEATLGFAVLAVPSPVPTLVPGALALLAALLLAWARVRFSAGAALGNRTRGQKISARPRTRRPPETH